MSELKTKLLGYRRIEKVHIEELDCDVCVKRMTGTEATAFHVAQSKARVEAETKGDEAFLGLLSLLVSMTVCDADGKPIFASADEVDSLDSVIKDRLTGVAQHINGMTPDSCEEIKKKSEMITSGISSPTDGGGQSKK
jgi:hypothetical protein